MFTGDFSGSETLKHSWQISSNAGDQKLEVREIFKFTPSREIIYALTKSWAW